jgi:predicted aldo/keto reductase-like oxidoreductase
VQYAACRVQWDLSQMKNPSVKQVDEVKAAAPGYQQECNEAWPKQPKGETQKIQDCVKKHPKCPAALDCFATMAVDDDE